MADTTAAKRRLIEIVRQRSFSTGGETKLVSGRSTSFYFDMKPSMLHPEGAQLMATLILDALRGAKVDLIGGLEMGAVPLATAVAVASQAAGPAAAGLLRAQAGQGARRPQAGRGPGARRDASRASASSSWRTSPPQAARP